MKVFLTVVMLCLSIMALAACDGKSFQNSPQDNSAHQQNNNKGDKMLVAYFSHSGNTRVVANDIKELAGADIFEIVPVKPYPQDYNNVLGIAKQEKNAQARPELLGTMPDVGKYDVIFVGYPNWWGTMPMPVFTFLDKYNLAGKTVVPFCTHGGSGLGTSESDLASAYPNAKLLKGLAIRGSRVQQARGDVEKWLKGLNLINR